MAINIQKSILVLLGKEETHILLISTMAGAVTQILCQRDIKNHPEFLDENSLSKIEPKIPGNKKIRGFRIFLPRGGQLLEYPIFSKKFLIEFLSREGVIAGFFGGMGLIGGKIISSKQLSTYTYLYKSYPYHL